MADSLNDICFDLLPKNSKEVNKREFLIKEVKDGKKISKKWTEEQLEEASNEIIEKLYDKYQNSPPVKINKQEALNVGKPVCPVVIEMYAEGLKTIVDQMPYINRKFTINVKKLETNILENKKFCDNLAIRIGSEMIKHAGENSVTRMGMSLAAMTWGAVERVEVKTCEDNKDEGFAETKR